MKSDESVGFIVLIVNSFCSKLFAKSLVRCVGTSAREEVVANPDNVENPEAYEAGQVGGDIASIAIGMA